MHPQTRSPADRPDSRLTAVVATAHRWGRSLLLLARRFPVLTGTLLVGSAYGLMNLGWRDAGAAALVYSVGAYLLASLSHGHRRAYWLASAWNLAFVIDLGIRAFLITTYRARPEATLVLEAISNTNSNESAEFFMNYWRLLGAFTLQLSVLLVLLLISTRAEPGQPSSGRRGRVAAGVVFALMHLDPAVRSANPLLFWPAQAATVEELLDNVDTLHAKRLQAQAQLGEWQPHYTGPERHTVGLVIGESTNRWNLQLYGYPRATNPQLGRQPAEQLLVFRDVISATSSTVSALRHMLTPLSLRQTLKDEEQPSVLMLARAAGYKVFWISNQHDRYISTRFAEEADVRRLLNMGGDVENRSLDERVLPDWEQALADPAPRKLIIVHLMGAHAHYEMRSPESFKRFDNLDDAVDRQLAEQGRPDWLRLKRKQYDDAILYQDWVLDRLLDRFRSAVGSSSASWLYTSDHGEEVGHTRDFAGHSPDEAGQVVPLLVWNSKTLGAQEKAQLEQRPFQSDVLDWTLLDLLRVRTLKDQPENRLLGDQFRPAARQLANGEPYPTGDARQVARLKSSND